MWSIIVYGISVHVNIHQTILSRVMLAIPLSLCSDNNTSHNIDIASWLLRVMLEYSSRCLYAAHRSRIWRIVYEISVKMLINPRDTLKTLFNWLFVIIRQYSGHNTSRNTFSKSWIVPIEFPMKFLSLLKYSTPSTSVVGNIVLVVLMR